MGNRLLAYRIVVDVERRRRDRWRRRPALTLAQVADQLLRGAVRQGLAGEEAAARLEGWRDYDLAVAAGVSVRQTSELFEEVGLGDLVREALDRLHERGLIRVAHRPTHGTYRGFEVTEEAVAMVDLRPWYVRLLAFFAPPPPRTSTGG